MTEGTDFAVVNLSELVWPELIPLPSSRFRLLVAADTAGTSVETISNFAKAALSRGMVYFCAWGRGSERFHDVVDEVLVVDDLGERRFSGSKSGDVVMTTWHEGESLAEALEFFTTLAVPTEGLVADSSFRFVICIANGLWAKAAREILQSAAFVG